jgi:hypothetical protein
MGINDDSEYDNSGIEPAIINSSMEKGMLMIT